MIGLDTNVLVRYLTQDDAAQAKKANALVAEAVASRTRLHLEAVVLCELVWVLNGAYRVDKATIVETLSRILESAQFSVADRDLAMGALAAYRAGAGDFADYLLGGRNRDSGCQHTVTFDRSLKGSRLFSLL
jgi:predicted nucleic-acid-binding protein